ncbi:transcriptional regulator, Fis family [Pyrobaculum islandicum DSM 4184]|uniref:Transcriptional regulator, Fis family n=1 Tax=Pyrobaculum islandicum (strain DSM 4184 / JCM 9189 / GEO3) TaxID=384616 RepID=A1RV72_PYRIL|nr:MmgE/PrpD family protein [Pyrobaculum islandicum]ABL88854.1 transcriptional regulator, Fis family [Pyrobaculum islandicum DSM 4184]
MDRITKILAEYTIHTDFSKIPSETRHEVKRRVIDSIAVAFAAYTSEPVALARRIASKFSTSEGARIMGTRYRVSPDWATFVNGVMIRYHDYNDTYLSKEPLHPSDLIAAALSIGEYVNSRGADLIAAIAIGYEAAVTFCDGGTLRKRGWDHVNFLGIGSTLAAAKLLGLDTVGIQHALALYAVPHAAMRQTRVGELSMWKGAAAANASRNAVFATLLAREGFTGPYKPFEGEMGFFRQLLQGDFDVSVLQNMEELKPPRRILDTYIKPYPVEYHAQTAVEAALRLREKVRLEEIEKIRIDTYEAAYTIIGPKDPEKWDPHTKETADHSIMWVTAAALVWGPIKIEHYRDIRNPTVLSLMKKMEVNLDPELDKLYPQAFPTVITVVTKGGSKYTERVDYAKGHPKNPMSDRELEDKFNMLTRDVMPEEVRRRVLNILWRLENYSVTELLDALAL